MYVASDTRFGVLYPVRSAEVPVIRRERIGFFRRVVGDENGEEAFQLTWKEFIMISVLLQTNINYFNTFLGLAITHGGLSVSLMFFVLQLIIGMPLFMLCTFMSSYARRSYIKFWDCVPVFQGLGFTIAIIRFTSEMYNIMCASLSLVLIFDMFRDNHINKLKTCLGDVDKRYCLPMEPREPLEKSCPTYYTIRREAETVFIATQFYLRKEIMDYDEFIHECCTFNIKMIIASLCVWILTFSLSILGGSRIRKMTINLQIVFGFCLLLIGIYSTFFSDSPAKSITFHTDTHADSFKFWVDMILYSVDMNVIGNAIYLGKLKVEALSVTRASLIITFVKLAAFLAVVCYASRIRRQLITHYRMQDPNCLITYSHDIIFAFVPDVLFRQQGGYILAMLWYLGIFFFALLPVVYSLVGLVDSLSEYFKKLNKYRLFVYLACCVLGVVFHLPLCTDMSLAFVYTYRIYGIPLLNTITFFLINLALMFIYSIKRIVDDYSFSVGSPPSKYWIVSWRATPIFSLFALIFMLYQIQTTSTRVYTTVELMLFSYVQSCIILLPIVIVFLAKCCKHVKYRTLGSLSKPSEKWGPHNPAKKQARKYFYPERDVRYRNSVLQCQHNCIINSRKFHTENTLQNRKLQVLMTKLKRCNIRLPDYN